MLWCKVFKFYKNFIKKKIIIFYFFKIYRIYANLLELFEIVQMSTKVVLEHKTKHNTDNTKAMINNNKKVVSKMVAKAYKDGHLKNVNGVAVKTCGPNCNCLPKVH